MENSKRQLEQQRAVLAPEAYKQQWRSFQVRVQEYRRGIQTEQKTIFLTFDDGPVTEFTPWVLDTLKAYQAKATFFCIGDNISKHSEIFEQLLSDGHAIGNHTYNHLNGRKTPTKEYISNVEKSEAIMKTFVLCNSL